VVPGGDFTALRWGIFGAGFVGAGPGNFLKFFLETFSEKFLEKYFLRKSFWIFFLKIFLGKKFLKRMRVFSGL